jgi:uncharacterized protein
MVERVVATQAARAWIDKLTAQHGTLAFHQSGGCCDGSSPMCFQKGEFKLGGADILLGLIGSAEFHIAAEQYKLWEHTQLIIDVVQGRGASFSLEIPEGIRFLTRGRMFTDAELVELKVPPSSPAAAVDRTCALPGEAPSGVLA